MLESINAATSVLKLDDWIGGEGSKPSGIGQYVGPTGLVAQSSQAVNVRGPQGQAGQNGINGQNGSNGQNGVSINDVAYDRSTQTLTVNLSDGQTFSFALGITPQQDVREFSFDAGVTNVQGTFFAPPTVLRVQLSSSVRNLIFYLVDDANVQIHDFVELEPTSDTAAAMVTKMQWLFDQLSVSDYPIRLNCNLAARVPGTTRSAVELVTNYQAA